MQIFTGKERGGDKKLTKKQKEQFLALGLMDIEVLERKVDPETGKYYDQLSGFEDQSSKKSRKGRFADAEEPQAHAHLRPGAFLGLARNEDEVTKILISKNDQLKDKLNRQVVFGPDGPIEAPEGDVAPKQLDQQLLDRAFGGDTDEDGTDEEEAVPLIDKLRQELAVDLQKQKALEQELNIPKFEKDEQVEVADEDVSDEEEVGDADDANNKKKAEQYQIIKDRLRKNKGGNLDDI